MISIFDKTNYVQKVSKKFAQSWDTGVSPSPIILMQQTNNKIIIKRVNLLQGPYRDKVTKHETCLWGHIIFGSHYFWVTLVLGHVIFGSHYWLVFLKIIAFFSPIKT